MKNPSVFLSYSSKDKPLARRIAEDLRRQDIDVWLDKSELLVGDSITQSIQHGLDTTDFLVVLLTTNSLSSGWVEKEWSSKVGHEASTRNVVILPLKADTQPLPLLLRDKKYADFSVNYDTGIAELVSAVRGHVLRRKAGADGVNVPNMTDDSGFRKATQYSQHAMKRPIVVLLAVLVSTLGGYYVYFSTTPDTAPAKTWAKRSEFEDKGGGVNIRYEYELTLDNNSGRLRFRIEAKNACKTNEHKAHARVRIFTDGKEIYHQELITPTMVGAWIDPQSHAESEHTWPLDKDVLTALHAAKDVLIEVDEIDGNDDICLL